MFEHKQEGQILDSIPYKCNRDIVPLQIHSKIAKYLEI